VALSYLLLTRPFRFLNLPAIHELQEMCPDNGTDTTIIFAMHTSGFGHGDGVYGNDETVKTAAL